MCFRRTQLLFCVISSAFFCSCSGKPDYGKEVFPVTGEVYVDGAPTAEVAVVLHSVKGMDANVPTVSSTFTKEDGKFALSTFEEGDGVPAGEYVATFTWGKFNGLSMTYDDSKLKGRYADPKKSQFKVNVAPGQPTDMGRIELTTK